MEPVVPSMVSARPPTGVDSSRVQLNSPTQKSRFLALVAWLVLHQVCEGLLLQLRIRFSSFSIFCHFDPCDVVPYFVAFRLFSFPWLEEVTYFIFPSLFWSSRWSVCLVLGAEARVPFCCFLLPIVHLVAMQFSWPSAISFFCVFESSMEHWLLSSFSTAVTVLLFMYHCRGNNYSY